MGIRLRCWQLAQEHKLVAWACLSAALVMTEIGVDAGPAPPLVALTTVIW